MKQENSRIKDYIVAIACVAAGIFVDQFSKALVVSHLKDQAPVVLIDHVLELKYLENSGAAFGLFQNRQVIFLVFSLVITAVVIWFYYRLPMDKKFFPLRIVSVLLVAGAIGNCIDRIRTGYVVDFIYFKLIDFPIFNVADIFVTVAVFALIILLIFYYKEEDLDQVFQSRKRREGTD